MQKTFLVKCEKESEIMKENKWRKILYIAIYQNATQLAGKDWTLFGLETDSIYLLINK